MRIWHFTEAPYPELPDESEYESVKVTLPSRHYDPVLGADLWHRYLDEWQAADELGLDVMVNEHHATATCINPAAPVIASILARITERSRILVLGNPVANRPDPVRVAEEMAVIDVISRGRLEVGFVRGVPFELLPTNTLPVDMTERMWEAIDLIIESWTRTDGPFSWEGEHFHSRNINVWPRTYQSPTPPVWVTGMSPMSARRIAQRGFVNATFLNGFDGTRRVFDAYRESAAAVGNSQAPDRLAYCGLVFVGDTEKEAMAGAKKLHWYISSNKVTPPIANQPGYLSPRDAARLMGGAKSPLDYKDRSIEDLIEAGTIFAGTPDTVFEQITKFYDHVGGFGHLISMGQAGWLSHEETVASMTRLANDVYPRLRAWCAARELECPGGGADGGRRPTSATA